MTDSREQNLLEKSILSKPVKDSSPRMELNVYYIINKSPPLVIIPSLLNPIYTFRYYFVIHSLYGSRDIAVSVATGYGLDSRRVSSPVNSRIFLLSTSSRTVLSPTHPPIQLVQGPTSLGVKWPRRETDPSLQTSAQIKNTRIYISTPPYAFMA
jgi:hypothetical protein